MRAEAWAALWRDGQPPAIVIYPPAEDGGRRIRVDEHFVGLAYGMLDIVEREPSPALETS